MSATSHRILFLVRYSDCLRAEFWVVVSPGWQSSSEALGNYINAWVQPATHSSIGASTAVFAALGVLVSHSLHHWGDDDRHKRLKRWSPLIGGVVLLGLTGVGGERTDVAAHVTGFVAGMLMGWVGCRLPDRWLASTVVQQLAGVTAVVIVTTAWVVAVAVG